MKTFYCSTLLLFIGLVYSYWFGYTPVLLGLIYLLASLVAYYLYAKDKKAAINGMWRVPENTLHLSALFGGWPGAMVAQQRLRHKTKKMSFRLMFYITFLINIGFVFWLHTPDGSTQLHIYLYRFEYFLVDQFGSNEVVTMLLVLTKFHSAL
ncbi:DUF1294 domain-containing protein [Neptuniibacter sp. 1_MG-2023]|uniref:DUF1294 domain-containing protein n=1 Tax=Neptuniibacter sp. 1_MG-2023 TaxID=3062662 RepID=UPI0026E1975A|nr:DUF1294 domain-containing protein [Neptuniibacter sp. 1_MG-2023]MDO6593019.1 DUF1294 domain-containing protein [Neptuniibacter sp. 1_MG-2023]